jgi:hypothetical protein
MTPVAAGQEIEADHINQLITLFARKTADETVNNSAVLQNDDHLLLTLAANATYSHFLNLTYQSNSTPALQIDFTLPSGASMIGNTFACGGSGASFQHGVMPSTSLIGAAGTGGNTGLRVWGLIVVGATSGTARLQWAQSVANASNTIVRNGSFWEVRRVA